MRILNLGILAHVDAGKTTLTERLLFSAGVIDHVGSVDEGSTHTDFLPLERQRGITIKSAVVNFSLGDVSVNLIDTPGHPDFIAEVERILCTLDGAVLVISAVEGVQAQTRILTRALQRLDIPTLIFVNKIDRPGAQQHSLVDQIRQKLRPDIVVMGATTNIGSRQAEFVTHEPNPQFGYLLAEALAAQDDALLDAYTAGKTVDPQVLLTMLAQHSSSNRLAPVFFGSAITGAGIEALMAGVERFLPAAENDDAAEPSGTIFKIERGHGGERVAFVRLFSGCLEPRQMVSYGSVHEGKVTSVDVFENGRLVRGVRLRAGRIGKIGGLSDVRVGDSLGRAVPRARVHAFAPPTLETAVVPLTPDDKPRLHAALGQLAEQDPLINLRQDDLRQELYVSLYGEVQKEVIEATLGLEFGVQASFRETSQIYVERPAGAADSLERLGKNGNPFLATIGFRVEPGEPDSGVTFQMDVDLVTVPLYVYKSVDLFRLAMEEYVRSALEQGLHGWKVTDCAVTMTECGYAAPATGSRDYRLLTPLVLLPALSKAGTVICEPVNIFELELPPDSLPAVMSLLNRFGAVPHSSEMRGAVYVLKGEIAAGRVHELRQMVPALTRGEGVVEVEFHGYRPTSAPKPPQRPRSDLNPLNRREYLLRLAGRM